MASDYDSSASSIDDEDNQPLNRTIDPQSTMKKLLPAKKGPESRIKNGNGRQDDHRGNQQNRRQEKEARKNEDLQSRQEDPIIIEEIEDISDDKSSSIDSDKEELIPPLTAKELSDNLFFMPKDQDLFMLHLNEACEDS